MTDAPPRPRAGSTAGSAWLPEEAPGSGSPRPAGFAVEGAAVSVWDRESEGVRDAVRTIEEAGGAATGAVVDLGDAISVREAAVSTVAELGAVTVLMNNASVLDD
jgi:3-oxoacyl-[acyl-carrier protein] reductase